MKKQRVSAAPKARKIQKRRGGSRICYSGLVSTINDSTINDVAKRAGVSATTAKRAIRAPDKLAPATLERVQRAVRELNYEPDRLASALRSGQSTTVGLIIGSIVEPFFAELTRAAGRALRARGYTLIVAENEYDSALELEQLREFRGNRVGGLVIRAGYGGQNLDYLTQLSERGTAVVEVDYAYPTSPFSHVLLDNEAAMMEAVGHLHALGHRRVAYIGMASQPGQPEERYEGFLGAAQRFALTLPAAYHAGGAAFATGLSEDDAYAITTHLLAAPEPPSAVIAFNGTCTSGAFRAVRDAGLELPTDLSLVGFDNCAWTGLVSPAVSVIEQPTEAMAGAAVEILLGSMGNREAQVVRRRFEGRLLHRGSTGTLPL